MSPSRAVRIAIAGMFAAFLVGPVPIAYAAASDYLLPDLAMVAPFDFRIEISPEGRKLLRFSTVLVNIGRGPFQAYGYDTDGSAQIGDTLHVKQQIKKSDGTWTVRDSTATMTWAGDGHDHWHINGYQKFVLNTLDGHHKGYVAKTGFCAFDSYPYTSTKPAWYTWEHYACRTAPTGRVPMGTSRYWGDIYRSTIAFQWIDVTGPPTGH